MKKKLVALLLVSAMTAAMVVGCGSGEEKKTEETKTVVSYFPIRRYIFGRSDC